MLITTTNSINNAKIEQYLGVVTTNLVIGTNFLSDFIASFSDLFGGMSGTYREQMNTLYEKAHNAISQKARTIGANAILGFRMDFDEITGKGKQMFMISVSGTAIKLKFDKQETIPANSSVSCIQLAKELFKEHWGNRGIQTPKREELNFIIEYGLWELVPSLYDYYASPYSYENEVRPIDEDFPIILSMLSYDEIITFIYNDYEKRHERAYHLIQKYKLFNATKCLEILHNNLTLGLELLKIDKKEYYREDLITMKEILSFLNNLPNKGKIEMTKSGILSSKMTEMYICPKGHKNNKDVEYCEGVSDGSCGLNIKGLTREQVSIIKSFRDKVTILEKLIQTTNLTTC